jgi:hypothetical protein
MSTSIEVEPETGIAIATCSGVLRVENAREAARALWETPGWRGRSAVWDFRAAAFDVSAAETREIAKFVLERQPTPPPARIAFVTQRDVDFGMARMFGILREDPGTAFSVFRRYEEAIRWARSVETGAA